MKEITHIKDLKPDLKNARRHNPRNIGQIENSLRQYGAARSIVIDEEGKILAGHGVIEAAAQAGIEKVEVVEANGNTIIAVQRKGLTEKQKAELSIADNRTTDLSTWDLPALENLDLDLSQWFLPYELAQMGAVSDPNDPETEWKGMPDFKQDDESPFRTLFIHFKTAADVDSFSQLIHQSIGSSAKYLWYPAQGKTVAKDKAYKAEKA